MVYLHIMYTSILCKTLEMCFEIVYNVKDNVILKENLLWFGEHLRLHICSLLCSVRQ